MTTQELEERLFFDSHEEAYSLYTALRDRLLTDWPDTRVKVQKSQISFANKHIYACVSFLRVVKKADMPPAGFVLTLGLPMPLISPRVAAKTEPYPGRWTTHLVLSDPAQLDEELLGWVQLAYDFAQSK